jgi:hypothetical protein
MALLNRPDGTIAVDAPGYRRFMPALMPTRNGSVVYFDQRLRVDETERYLAQVRAEHRAHGGGGCRPRRRPEPR